MGGESPRDVGVKFRGVEGSQKQGKDCLTRPPVRIGGRGVTDLE